DRPQVLWLLRQHQEEAVDLLGTGPFGFQELRGQSTQLGVGIGILRGDHIEAEPIRPLAHDVGEVGVQLGYAFVSVQLGGEHVLEPGVRSLLTAATRALLEGDPELVAVGEPLACGRGSDRGLLDGGHGRLDRPAEFGGQWGRVEHRQGLRAPGESDVSCRRPAEFCSANRCGSTTTTWSNSSPAAVWAGMTVICCPIPGKADSWAAAIRSAPRTSPGQSAAISTVATPWLPRRGRTSRT